MLNLFHLTDAPLSQLREHEWLWRSPLSELPGRQRLYRFLDPLCFGQLSRLDLDEARRKGIRDTKLFFSWVCSSIEVNNKFSEAYGWRSISGNELFCDFGRTQRLQGWDHQGEEWYYDVDCAVVDALLAATLRPNWDWSVRVSGVMAAVKALRAMEDQQAPNESGLWLDFAQRRLHKAIELARKPKNQELITRTEVLISDLEHWSKHGSLPKGSELGELYRK